jgi:hypothetical protein
MMVRKIGLDVNPQSRRRPAKRLGANHPKQADIYNGFNWLLGWTAVVYVDGQIAVMPHEPHCPATVGYGGGADLLA